MLSELVELPVEFQARLGGKLPSFEKDL